jgi:hypothetical protein
MKSLMVEVVENGFMVQEGDLKNHMMDKKWVFETPETFAAWMREWAEKNQTVRPAMPAPATEQQE